MTTITVERATRDELTRFLTTDPNGGWDDDGDDEDDDEQVEHDEAGGDESLSAHTE